MRARAQALFVVLPIMLWQLISLGAERHMVAWFVGGLFAVTAAAISVLDISERARRLRNVGRFTCVHSDARAALSRPWAADIGSAYSVDGASCC